MKKEKGVEEEVRKKKRVKRKDLLKNQVKSLEVEWELSYQKGMPLISQRDPKAEDKKVELIRLRMRRVSKSSKRKCCN